MALDFPHVGLTVGQKYPAAPVSGVPTYTWDGEKWQAGQAIILPLSAMTAMSVQVVNR